MKSILCLVFTVIGVVSFGQTTTDEDLKKLWQSHVIPIIDLEVEDVVSKTQFPLEGEWYMIIDEEADPEEELFVDNFERIFTEEIRELLNDMDYNSLSVMGDDTWTLVTLLVVLSTDDEGWVESSMSLEFEFLDGMWKLVTVDVMG
jgi:hypothetical protein